MSSRPDLTLFGHVCSSTEPGLAEAALLIAEIAYPDLDIPRYLRRLDELGEGAREAAGAPASAETSAEERLERAVRWLYEEVGFHGNERDYYDPRNSFLNDVLDRRTGIPISLAVVLLDVCQRAGIFAFGISFPSHFLVGFFPGPVDRPDGGDMIVDPFTGHLLDQGELQALYARVTGDNRDAPRRLLMSATKSQIMLRMLANLRAIYAARADQAHLLAVLERIQVLAPNDELAREIRSLGGTIWQSPSPLRWPHKAN